MSKPPLEGLSEQKPVVLRKSLETLAWVQVPALEIRCKLLNFFVLGFVKLTASQQGFLTSLLPWNPGPRDILLAKGV